MVSFSQKITPYRSCLNFSGKITKNQFSVFQGNKYRYFPQMVAIPGSPAVRCCLVLSCVCVSVFAFLYLRRLILSVYHTFLFGTSSAAMLFTESDHSDYGDSVLPNDSHLMSETAYISCSENAQHDDSRTQTNHIANSSDFTQTWICCRNMTKKDLSKSGRIYFFFSQLRLLMFHHFTERTIKQTNKIVPYG